MTATQLWLVDVLLVVITLATSWFVWRGRSTRVLEQRNRYMREASDILDSRPDFTPVVEALGRVYPDALRGQHWPTLERSIAILIDSDSVRLAALCDTIKPIINSYNRFAILIDEELVRPKDFVMRHPEQHLQALVELAVVAPIIWYESLIAGRGRWGYRPLQVLAAFEQLRAVSDRPAVWQRVEIDLRGIPYELFEAVPAWRRDLLKAFMTVRAPRISVRTKVRQNRRARRLAKRLRKFGYPTVDLGRVPHAIYW